MHIQMIRNIGFDVTQEGEELLMPMAALALREHAAVGDVERGEQGRSAVADVVVRDAFDVPQSQRQKRLRALERLYLALLINTQHQRMIRRIEVQADDVAHLLDEERVARELEALRAVRLQPK